MIIAHYKKTNIACAPEAICDLINKYTEHKSYVFGFGYSNKKLTPNTNILHQHNVDAISFDRKIIQYHSEPFRVNLKTNIKKLVIAQYHATLPEYKNCVVVRNPIDLYNEYFIPKYQGKKIKIGYSPSNTKPGSVWADKGYVETIGVLDKIKNKYGNLVDIDIIIGVPLDECLRRKSMCNIFIDEVKTPSYHRSGLESLAMGCATICSISPDVEKILLEKSGAPTNPFINVDYLMLERKLIELIELGLVKILEIGYSSRVWMENYWNPMSVVNEYIEIYKNEIK